MPRNASGTYSLVAGNPVSAGTLIEASWANNTLSDLASAMTDSLSRTGEGGMTAALRLADGTVSAPGLAFTNETATGFYRAGSGDVRLSIAGSQVVQYLASGMAVTGTLSSTGNATFASADIGGGYGSTGATISSAGNISANGTLTIDGASTLTGRVGVGAAPTTGKFDVRGSDSSIVANFQDSGTPYIRVTNGTEKLGMGIGSGTCFIGDIDGAPLVFRVSNAEKMRLDTAGNLGLGVTPSAWSIGKVFQIRALDGAFVYGDSLQGIFGENAYFNSGWKYGGTGAAGFYSVSSGVHSWHTAPSGTAGNAITFTQAMTLDASGNLGVGTTSPGAKLDVNGLATASNFKLPSSGNAALYWGSGGTQVFGNNESGTEAINFYVAGAERARIDSSGNLLVNSTGFGSANTAKIYARQTAAGGYAFCADAVSNGGTYYLAAFQVNQTTTVGTITSNGTGTTYGTSSDYRLKENVQPMAGALAKVAALKPVTYKWKLDGSYGEGFIAHELAEVCPGAVQGEKDAVDAEGKPQYQGIDTSFLVATLTAAIQEQQALIQSLTARLEALEGASDAA